MAPIRSFLALFLLLGTLGAMNLSTASYSVDSFHWGSAGGNLTTSSYQARSTLTYQGPGNRFGTSGTYLENVGWFSDIIAQNGTNATYVIFNNFIDQTKTILAVGSYTVGDYVRYTIDVEKNGAPWNLSGGQYLVYNLTKADGSTIIATQNSTNMRLVGNVKYYGKIYFNDSMWALACAGYANCPVRSDAYLLDSGGSVLAQAPHGDQYSDTNTSQTFTSTLYNFTANQTSQYTVMNLSVSASSASINWTGSELTLNNTNPLDLDQAVVLADRFAYVNSSSFAGLNQTPFTYESFLSNVTLYGVDCSVGRLYVGDASTRQGVLNQQTECDPSTCINQTCSAGTLSFLAAHYTGYAYGTTANLTIFDSNDTLGGGIVALANQTINFSANYTNSTSGQPIFTSCFQEFANQSTSCGGLSTGNYSQGGLCNNNTFDGNYSSYSYGCASGGALGTGYVNYSKPANYSLGYWQVKDGGGTFNLSIPDRCFNQSVLQFSIGTTFSAGNHRGFWYCYNGTDFELLRASGSLAGQMYEEAMIWGELNTTQCTIRFNDTLTTENMTYDNALLLHRYYRSFNSTGNRTWNVSCTSTGYDALNASDNIFIRVSPLNITVTSPSGIYNGTTSNIDINYSNATADAAQPIDHYEIRLHQASTGALLQILTWNNSDALYFNWTLSVGNGSYYINVTAYDNLGLSSGGVSPTFSISGGSPSDPVLIAPNGGEYYVNASSVSISWVNSTSSNISSTIWYWLFYSNNSGLNWTFIANTTSGPYSWNVTGLAYLPTYRVRLYANDSTGISGNDSSDSDFTLSNVSAITNIIRITTVGNRSSLNFTCFQPYMFPVQPNGQNSRTPFYTMTSINGSTYYNITAKLNQSLPSGFRLAAQPSSSVNPSSVYLNTSDQIVIKRLQAAPMGLWVIGNCSNVTMGANYTFTISFGAPGYPS